MTLTFLADAAEVRIMLATRVKRWEQEILLMGIEYGFENGLPFGKAAMLHHLLRRRFLELLPTSVDEH